MAMEPKHQAASGLNSCPAEILYSVFQLLSSTELHAVCLVDKMLRVIAEPFLYSKIQMIWRGAHPDPPPPISQLLRTLLSRPQLAAYITNLHLDGDTYIDQFRFKFPKVPFPDAELDKPIAFIQATGVPYSDLWIQELRQGTMDAFIALLLVQLPNLKCLYLARDFTRRTALVGMVLRSAICEPVDYSLPDFRHLQDVSFLKPDGWDVARDTKVENNNPNTSRFWPWFLEARDKKVKNTSDILPFFYLPSIQRLSSSIENPGQFTWPAAHAPVPSKLTSFVLTTVREAYLGELLAVTQNLESLRWHWYYDESVKDRFTTPIVDLDRIAAAISHVSGTLTDLAISADCSNGVDGDIYLPGIKTEGSLHAMVNFDMLKRLQIPWPFLLGFAQDTTKQLRDVIPRNIEYLSITDDLNLQNEDRIAPEWPQWEWRDSAIVGLLQSWLKDWKACTPHLRGIILLLHWIDEHLNKWSWSPTVRDQLRELSIHAGVPIEIIEREGDYDSDFFSRLREPYIHSQMTLYI